MRPSDALPQDWRMYYDGVWMNHPKHGPGMVSVQHGDLYLYKFPNGQPEAVPVLVRPSELECWWPRSSSFNTPNGAVYIARKSSRTMRKSAMSGEHYIRKWGTSRLNQYSIMLLLRTPENFLEAGFALKALEEKITNSVAVSRDIILSRAASSRIEVIFRGMKAGELKDNRFEPDFPNAPVARRALHKLQEAGVVR